MILSEFENRTLEISYYTGSGKGGMKIAVRPLMEQQTVTKIRKLLKIIRTSDDPDAEQVLADFCRQWLALYEPEQKTLADRWAAAKGKAREIEIGITDLQEKRNNYKRNTEPYKEYTRLLKTKRGALSDVKWVARSSMTDFNRNQKAKAKYEKVLGLINQGG